MMDNREKLNNADRQVFFKDSFIRKKIPFTVETLQVGDFLWVARKKAKDGDPTLIVLDFVMERKVC
jgi:ERCC4-type nuclease